MHTRLSSHWWFTALTSCCLMLVAGFATYEWLWRKGLESLHEMETLHQDLIARDLRANLARFDYLPALLETSPAVMQLLQTPENNVLQELVSNYLHQVNATAGAELLYITDEHGYAIAADDAKEPGTPFHTSFAFRPYVKQALTKGHGRFFGIGITTGRAGFYLSYALPSSPKAEALANGQSQPPSTPIQGIAVVKIGFRQVEQSWANLSSDVIVTDENGVIVLTTKEQWRYHSLAPLSVQARTRIAQNRTYPTATIDTLNWQKRAPLNSQAHRIKIEGKDYLGSQRTLESGLFNIIVLEETTTLRRNAFIGAMTISLAVLVLCLLWIGLQMRKRSWQEKLANQAALQAAHDHLEYEVQRRTTELKKTQKDLVHAEKMAALGQMSAALTHEINQPLAAMRTLSDNAVILQQRGKYAVVADNLNRLTHLVDRLAAISQRLKVVAHKSHEEVQPIELQSSFNSVLLLLENRLKNSDIQITIHIEPDNLRVLGLPITFEQVMTNIINNAIDAIESQRQRLQTHAAITKVPQSNETAPNSPYIGQIQIDAAIDDLQYCRIAITDNGTGIDEQLLARLFEPFATSKPMGKGLGLGLSISAQLLKEMNGTISASNVTPHGAEFIITLGYEISPMAGPLTN